MAILFFAILLLLIYINAKVNGGFKIETSWIAIALSPIVIWMVVSGQVAEFGGFGLNFKLKEASAKPFSLNLEGDKIEPVGVTMGAKEGIEMIPNLVQRQVAAMALQVGRTGYYANWAIQEYLQKLTQHSFFKYVVFIDGAGKFRGMMWAADY